MGFFHKLRVLVWGEAPATEMERKLLRKIDFFIMFYCCISYFFNYLDRAAVGNAYVSGMKEDTGLQGNDYNMMTIVFTVGYIVGQVPHGIAINLVAPRIWFPSMVIVWALLTMCFAACHNLSQILALRFLTGLVEASTYAGTQFIIGSWYKESEIAKRTGLFASAAQAGTMFGGIMMTAIYSGMNGSAGLPGWRWVFIIDGIITLPIAIFGFLYFPDLPATTKAPYFSAEERALAVSRLPIKSDETVKIDLTLFRRVLFTPNFWIFTLLWGIGGLIEGFSSFTCMLLWMKASGEFSVQQNNNYPLVISAIAIISTLTCAVVLDASQKRLPWAYLVCVLQIVTAIILLKWDTINNTARFAAYWLAGTSFAIQPIVFTWANIVLARSRDNAARAITLYSMNGSSSVFFAFWGIVFYPATDAATGFFKGTIAVICVSVFMAILFTIVYWQDKRSLKMYETDMKSIEGVEEVPSEKNATAVVNEKGTPTPSL